MSILKIENISTGYGNRQVLFDVNLEVKEGENILLVGSNGSGKSTLFKCIMGLIPTWENKNHSKASIIFENRPILGQHIDNRLKEGMMYIPQTHAHFEDLSVKDNLKISVLHLENQNTIKRRIEKVFDSIPTLGDLCYREVSRLSGGERKLVSLGMIMCNEPKILLFDEPLAGISVRNEKLILGYLEKLKQAGITIINIEHRITEMLELSTRIIGMKLGKLERASFKNINEIKQFLI